MSNTMNHKTLITLISCCAAPFLQACGTGEAGELDRPQVKQAPLPVEMIQPVSGSIAARYLATTTLEADNEAQVSARAGGEIRQIHVEEGQHVKAGDLLITLDGERLRLDSLKSAANLAKLQQEYRRQVELHEKGLVAATNYEDLKFRLEAQQAAHDLAKLQYSYTRITAPISGIVVNRLVKNGQSVNPGDAVMWITDPDSLLARIKVPQSELGKFAIGQPASLQFDALPGLEQDARVSRISPTVDPSTGTFRMQISIDAAQGKIAAGMFSRVLIAYDQHDNALLLPEQAIVLEDTNTVVYVVTDGEAKRRVVQTGITDGGMTEILAGLENDETVIISGGRGLRDGTPVAAAGDARLNAG